MDIIPFLICNLMKFSREKVWRITVENGISYTSYLYKYINVLYWCKAEMKASFFLGAHKLDIALGMESR